MSLVLLIVDVNSSWHQRATSLLGLSYTLKFLENSEHLLSAVKEFSPEAVILASIRSREADLKRIRNLAHTKPGLPILIATERLSTQDAFLAGRAGATHLLANPTSNQEFIESLDEAIRESRERATQGSTQESEAGLLIPHSIKTLREVVQEHMTTVLSACRGNRSRAAKLLGIDRSTLRRRLNEFESDDAQVEI